MKFFSWPSVDMIRKANSIEILKTFKLESLSTKTVGGRLVAIKAGLGDGSISPIFGEQDCVAHWDIPNSTQFTRIAIKEQKQHVCCFELIEGQPNETDERKVVQTLADTSPKSVSSRGGTWISQDIKEGEEIIGIHGIVQVVKKSGADGSNIVNHEILRGLNFIVWKPHRS